jgi:preprotein translocase subunit YajC
MNFFIQDAWAQAGGGGAGGLVSLLPMVLIFVVFYFLLIRPQQKKAKEHRAMVADLSKGDEVVTNGGVLGKITDTDENFVTVEIASGVQVQVQRFAISQMMPKGTIKGGK